MRLNDTIKARLVARRGAAIAASLCTLAALACGCGSNDTVFGDAGGTGGDGTGATGGDGGSGGDDRPPARASRIDLLLTIDNSRSMADKQEVLSLSIPSLLDSFVNPQCVNGEGLPVVGQPASPTEPCPSGSERQYPPIRDIHVGVITTSLGGHGADACNPMTDPSNDDKGRLITRGPGGAMVSTYQGLGFLAWDPQQAKDPPGETSLSSYQTNLKGLVLGAGQVGCGYEASLESWYRFLVDPDPHDRVEVQNGAAVLIGTDAVLLAQRRAFLRPDSLLVVTMLSDENDCSIRDGGQFYFAAQIYSPGTTQPYRLPRPRAACAIDPNDPCCRSCGQEPGPGCSTANDACGELLTLLEDQVNLRCWHQKRRFGIDFLYPIDRYVAGLTNPQVQNRHGEIVQNPLFIDLNPNDAISEVRDERLVYLTGLVGVPWQDLARRNAQGKPDLVAGLDAQGKPRGAFQSGAELAQNGSWKIAIGEPEQYFSKSDAFPTDSLMLESVDPRTGIHPITGDPVAPPGAATNANPINGHEYSIPARDDLQYACVFPLIQPRNCASASPDEACDCKVVPNDNPLCQNAENVFTSTQYRAKAYPGIRQLWLAQKLANRAVVGSICPAQLSQSQSADFGYEPFVSSLVEAVAPLLKTD
jgi:hypothetical protein